MVKQGRMRSARQGRVAQGSRRMGKAGRAVAWQGEVGRDREAPCGAGLGEKGKDRACQQLVKQGRMRIARQGRVTQGSIG